MRSSKPRSRKNNRNRAPQGGGNIPNRVFDSSGPEGKVRGTPQQIIDKYQQLARDAQLSGDRVATENFSQHAEHYLRMLSAAQKEIDERREQQERENRERQAERDRERAERDAQRATRDAERAEQEQQQPVVEETTAGTGDQPDVVEPASTEDIGLVETPESKPRRARTPRKPRAPRKPAAEKAAPATEDSAAPTQDAPVQVAPDAAE
ncbi:DUF4167 domain-containing protein [Planktotalea sp.]|uniref:DUF4167 domain-containing protein n=1 Tax=Planktotalea sp. TaxID=2029877 RepID=UPI003F6AB1B1